jgi:hypothetical protein
LTNSNDPFKNFARLWQILDILIQRDKIEKLPKNIQARKCVKISATTCHIVKNALEERDGANRKTYLMTEAWDDHCPFYKEGCLPICDVCLTRHLE